MAVCSPFQVLEISDGTTTVNLLSPKSGFCLLTWSPAIAEPKGGGVWKDSQLAAGRQLAMRKLANVADAFVLAVRDHWPDDLIRDTQNLRRLLEKACAYRTSKWQDEEVWIKRQGVYEQYPTYTLIEDYRTPQDGNPHGSAHFWTAMGNSAFPEFKLIIEHEPWWRGDVPGTGTCVQTSGQQTEWEYDAWAINTALPVGIVREIIELASGRMLATDYAGAPNSDVWRTDNGTVWNAATTPPNVPPASLLQASDGDVFAACNMEIWRSQDNGVNWVQRNAATGAQVNQSLAELGAWLYLNLQPASAIRRSNDDGATWNLVFQGPPTFLAIISASDGYLYAGGGSTFLDYVIYRSSNGTTWTEVYKAQWSASATAEVWCLAELSDGYLYAVAQRSIAAVPDEFHILRSANGTDWSIIATIVDSLTLSDPENIILASDGYYYLLFGTGEIWRSPNAFDWLEIVDIGISAGGLIEYSGNSRVYAGESGDIWWSPSGSATVGRAATCTDEVYVANKQNQAQLTDIYVYTAGPVWTAEFPHAGAFPYQLLPNPMANADAVYFGIDPAAFDSGPFDNLVFDVTTPASGTYTITWQYSNGAAGWPALNVQDGTSAFMAAGVNSVHWVPPAAWATEAVGVPAVTAYWVRALVGGVAGNPVGPQQGNRDVYTCNWPRVDVDDAQVLGDLPALMQFKFHNRSDEDGYEGTIDELDTLENRVVCGLRSMSRGADFTAFLNCADEQNPIGVTVTVGLNSAFGNDITAPTGRIVVHTTDGASTWADECIFTLSSSIAQGFYGAFHAYARAQEVDWDAAIDEVRVRLQVRTGSGGVTFTTEHESFRNLNDWQLLDFKGLSIPASSLLSSSDLGDESKIAIQVWSSASALTVNLYDLALIPTDEWALDAVDKALEDDSGVTNGYLLDVDSVTYPKRDIRALARVADDVGLIRSVYQPNTPGHAMLQANADQRLWFLTARGCVTGTHTGANNQPVLTDAAASFLTSGVEVGHMVYNLIDAVWGIITAVTATTVTATTLAGAAFDWDTNEEYLIVCPNWRSEPWNCHSIQVWNNARYLSMRGAR